MDDKPLVSVIIPTFNSEKYIEKCLQSVKSQTYGYIEIIVVDKNSIDKTPEIAERYASKVLLRGPERSTQRNHGAVNAKRGLSCFC
jgi:glycosyltransferase involved in cell wall biosynthesis